MQKILLPTAIAAVALATSLAFAGDKPMDRAQGAAGSGPWTIGHETYDAPAPMAFTCREFVTADEVYQPYVVAWLSGHQHKELAVGEAFVPVSVPVVVDQCKAHPDRNVSEIVSTIHRHHHG